MKQVEFSGEISEFQGMTVIPKEWGLDVTLPIPFSGVADAYENIAEAKASEDWPNESDILKVVNAKKLAAAKSSVYQEKTKALKAKYDASPAKARKDFIESVLKSPQINGDVAKANALADSMGF